MRLTGYRLWQRVRRPCAVLAAATTLVALGATGCGGGGDDEVAGSEKKEGTALAAYASWIGSDERLDVFEYGWEITQPGNQSRCDGAPGTFRLDPPDGPGGETSVNRFEVWERFEPDFQTQVDTFFDVSIESLMLVEPMVDRSTLTLLGRPAQRQLMLGQHENGSDAANLRLIIDLDSHIAARRGDAQALGVRGQAAQHLPDHPARAAGHHPGPDRGVSLDEELPDRAH